jgi:XRE family aerobic/anaerobic benzoate catabolism transcriptional regulator
MQYIAAMVATRSSAKEGATLRPRSKDALLAGIGSVVRAMREQRGLSRRELSERCGVSARFLADLEAGSGNISVARLAQVAQALQTSISALVAPAEGGAATTPPGSVAALLSRLSEQDLRETEQWIRSRFRPSRGPLVALLGLRGAGKTAIGMRLAEKLGVPFFEHDDLVERAAGLSLADIFSLHGEAYYRRRAREVLGRFLSETDAGVLATSGGVVTDREAYRLLQKHCVTVWLRATPQDHWQRVLQQGDTRPGKASADARSELRALLQARDPLYAQADVTVDTSRLGLEGSIREIALHFSGAGLAIASRPE